MEKHKELELLLAEGKITRREFLTRVSALGFATALSPALLTTPASAEIPKKGGRFRIGVAGGSTTDSLDPTTLPDTMATIINNSIRNNLVEVDASGNPIPELGESWEATPDAVKWIFKLRKDVEFHNGKTLDAQDVIESINLHRGEDSKSAAKAIVDQIKDLKADGKHTVVFMLGEGNADFPFILSDRHLTIQPAGTKGAEFEKGIGTGGYIMVEHEPGVRAFVRRNPNYWKKGRAHFDEIETIHIKDFSARTNALKTDQIDAMNRVDPKTMHMLKKSPGLTVLQVKGLRHYTFPMLTNQKPYDNKDVRLALKYAVDRKQLVAKVLRGAGSVGNDHPIAPILKYYNSELPQRKYDPDKAKYHIKKAGLEGHTFRLHTSEGAFAGGIDAAVLYKESAAKAGINIEVVREPSDGYWDNVWIKKPWCACFWYGRATADWMFTMAYAGDSKWNDSLWRNERFDKLLKEARAELNEDKRLQLYYECQKIVRDEGGVVIPMFADLLMGVSEKLRYDKIAGNGELDGFRIAERWWFA